MEKVKVKVIKSSSLIDFESELNNVVKNFSLEGYNIEIQYKPVFTPKLSSSSSCISTSIYYDYTALVIGRL